MTSQHILNRFLPLAEGGFLGVEARFLRIQILLSLFQILLFAAQGGDHLLLSGEDRSHLRPYAGFLRAKFDPVLGVS